MAGSADDWVKGSVLPNGLAVISLDRPKALNAMNADMTALYKKYLDEWENDSNVRVVLVESSSSRAFSAGMDVKGVAAAVKEDVKTSVVPMTFGNEYKLICKIARYTKPYISLMDGVTMGFGIGLSGHGRFRVITEKTILAMPENGIGLFPDVGFAHIAARSPGNGSVGSYMAMTGGRVSNPADALYVGLGTHFVPSEKLSSLKEAFRNHNWSNNAWEAVEDVLTAHQAIPESDSSLKALLPAITACFGASLSATDTIKALKEHQCSDDFSVAEWAKGALAGIAKGAPFSLCLTKLHYATVALAAENAIPADSPENDHSQIEGVMKTEYRLGLRTSTRSDFVEGVRAVLVDKDQKPKWQPATVEDVALPDIVAVFEKFENTMDELDIPAPAA
jgi:3-hydroxyisobutyryl-CoA hydrolase